MNCQIEHVESMIFKVLRKKKINFNLYLGDKKPTSFGNGKLNDMLEIYNAK